MSKSNKPYEFVRKLQVFHGFDIQVHSESIGPSTRIWEIRIPKIGFRLRGSHAEIMAGLSGYQAGFIAGRVYTRSEQEGLAGLIDEVEARFKAEGARPCA